MPIDFGILNHDMVLAMVLAERKGETEPRMQRVMDGEVSVVGFHVRDDGTARYIVNQEDHLDRLAKGYWQLRKRIPKMVTTFEEYVEIHTAL